MDHSRVDVRGPHHRWSADLCGFHWPFTARVNEFCVQIARWGRFLTPAVAIGGHRDTFNSAGKSVVVQGVFTCGGGWHRMSNYVWFQPLSQGTVTVNSHDTYSVITVKCLHGSWSTLQKLPETLLSGTHDVFQHQMVFFLLHHHLYHPSRSRARRGFHSAAMLNYALSLVEK